MMTNPWPALPLEEWKDTYATLHMWTQIVGKIRLAQTPPINHSWNVTLYVTPDGLTTSAMPYHERLWREGKGWNAAVPAKLSEAAQLILIFGSTALLKESPHLAEIRKAYPRAHVLPGLPINEERPA